jgi:restriction system protein
MSNIWLVRAGEGGRLIEEFAKGYVAVGWYELGDTSSIKSQSQLRKHYIKNYPNESQGAINLGFSMFYKFHSVIKQGDKILTYDTKSREYLVGTITGEYEYKPNVVGDYPHIRNVKWEGRVSRDDISASSKNSLGSIGTLFSVNEDVWSDIKEALSGKREIKDEVRKEEETSRLEEIRKEIKEKAHEFIKDKILELSPEDMENLVAAILRGMGYRTRISPIGPDRGIDVIASPDGLGLEEPRIKAEVKHRKNTTIGSQEIRSFLGGLREGDKALYVSTGGFTKEAKYEADRANIPITLLDLDDLASLVVSHYENFDLEGRALVPLVRVYWPAE